MKPLAPKGAFVTGGAGFIGSALAGELLDRGWRVTVFDNLSLGRMEFIEGCLGNPAFTFVKADLLDIETLKREIVGHDVVFHMSANSDISYGTKYTDIDLKQGTVATYNLLEAMRLSGTREIIFASTSAIYGETTMVPTPEGCGPLIPISLYGASKLACEGLISAFCHNYDFNAWIFRFGNIVGFNGTHGVIVDFIRKLIRNPRELEILGDGRQAKPYLYVTECVDGMLYGYEHSSETVNVNNLACEGATDVRRIAAEVISAMGLDDVELKFTGGERGWTGDVPQVRLDVSKLKRLGWEAGYDSDGAVKKAVDDLLKQMQEAF